jgi:hypothetical protein
MQQKHFTTAFFSIQDRPNLSSFSDIVVRFVIWFLGSLFFGASLAFLLCCSLSLSLALSLSLSRARGLVGGCIGMFVSRGVSVSVSVGVKRGLDHDWEAGP